MNEKELLAIDKKVTSELDQPLEVQQPIAQNTPFAPQNYELSPEEELDISNEVEAEKQFGDSNIEAGALGAARGLSFGISDQALVKSGIYSAEELSEIKKRNELASITGELGAIGAAALATGGTSLAAKGIATAGKGVSSVTKAGRLAENLGQKAFAKVLAEQGSKSIAKEIVRKAVPKALGSAVEGAAYGVGQLISEDALGEAELNAENIVAAAGTGALIGGAAGGLFAAPALIAPLAKKAGSKISSNVKLPNTLKNDPIDAALDIYGFSASQATKTKNISPKFVEELPQWTVDKAKLGVFTGTKKLKDNLINLRSEAGDKIGSTMSKIDEVAEANPGILSTSREAYGNVAKKVDDIIKEFETVPGFTAQIKPVKDIRNEFIKLAQDTAQINTKKIHSLRMKIDELIKFDKAPGQYTLKDKALNEVRFALNDEIQAIAEKASKLDSTKKFGNLLEDLKASNKDFSYASRLIPNIEKKADKEATKRGILSLTDFITGGSLLASDMTSAAAIAVGAKKLLESDIRRRVSILSSIERQNQKVSNTIKKSADFFIKKAAQGISTAAPATQKIITKALVNSNLSIPIDKQNAKKPKNKQEGFVNIRKNIIELTTNPDKLEQLVSRRTIHLQNSAPNITQESVNKVLAGLKFLASKMPKPAKENSASQMLTKREYMPSDLQLSKFERYVEAVENPMSVVESLSNGNISREGAEALKVVYPKIFEKLQETVMQKIQESPEAIPYNKRLQLGILLDVATDPSLESQNIAGLQENMLTQPTEMPGGPTAARADSLNMAERAETKQNRISQR